MMERHDSGCKNKMPLRPGVFGSAVFAGGKDEHRVVLERRWDGADSSAGFALWAGMNPSGAEAGVNDLTILKECHWTGMLGLTRYIKMNAGTYRWTDSAGIDGLSRNIELCHEDNLPRLRDLASRATVIILATGSPPERLIGPAKAMFRALKADGRKVKCLGTTQDGWPKHSSRLAYATPFVDYLL